MRRGRKEKEGTTDDSDHPPRPSDEPSKKEPTRDPEGDTDTAGGDEAGDVLTISEGAGAGGDENVSSDDASDTDGDVLTISHGSGASTGGDENVSSDDAAADEPGTDSAGDADTGTGNDTETGTGTGNDTETGTATGDGGTATGDAIVDDDQNVVTGDESQDSAIGDGDTADDAVSDSVVGGDVAFGDGTIADGPTGDSNVVGGDDSQQAVDNGDIDTGQGTDQSADVNQTPSSPIDLSLVRNARIGGGGPESPLAEDVKLLKDATDPQLDPAVIEARLGGRGPKPPDPDDTPDELAFGKGASGPATFDLDPVGQLPDGGLDPVGPTLSDTGLDPVGGVPPDDGLDPAGGAPPDNGLGPNEVQIDDTTPPNEPTEVDID